MKIDNKYYYLAAAILVVIVLVMVRSWLKQQPAKLFLKEAEKANDPARQTRSNADLAAAADTIYTTVKEPAIYVVTNADPIYGVLESLGNQQDFYGLVKAYGIRRIHSNFLTDDDFNMIQALNKNCTTYQVGKMNEILSRKGITTKI